LCTKTGIFKIDIGRNTPYYYSLNKKDDRRMHTCVKLFVVNEWGEDLGLLAIAVLVESKIGQELKNPLVHGEIKT